ncbi:MAG: 2-C-methyl-D-erythritol 4-phosphate cytidylyltransferase [Nitrospirae bacterium]|nr:MAG: 2-C-methyl-D-erythritol 4-phosphate cytidylyltransferase [Nitrospirota bacterium]
MSDRNAGSSKLGRVVAVIPAGGTGMRMGADVPKQFLPLGGVPMVLHSLRAFDRAPSVDAVILVVPREERQRALTDVIERYSVKKVQKVVAGGETRQQSVHNGLKETGPDVEIVVVHDAVRPFVTEDLIEQSIEAARKGGAVIVAVPMKDTPKLAGPDRQVQRTLDRDDLWLAQTPQTFRRDLLLEAYEKAAIERLQATDDAALVERLGHKVGIVAGTWENIKITSPEDLVIAEAILAARAKDVKRHTLNGL